MAENGLSVARYEFKYLIRPSQVETIHEYLAPYCTLDEHSTGGAWYPIRSLYLDNDRMSCYWDTEDSAPQRFKLRIRGYGDCAGLAKLEVKRRSMDLIQKTSAPADPRELRHCRHSGVSSGHNEFVRLMETLRATPKMLVEYERLAFTSTVDDYVRVTFDRRVRCQPVRDWQLAGDPRAWRLVDDAVSMGGTPSSYIMEMKFSVRAPAWLQDLTRRFGLIRRGFSKYGRSVRRWTREGEQAWDLRPNAFVGGWAGR
ncbi:MAG: polyphosphate polymerase domain-containing protein [Acidobacteria bacterium]|nr:polyphosphate polymerase domain-containing protein [Acidobacteriota bacterium]